MAGMKLTSAVRLASAVAVVTVMAGCSSGDGARQLLPESTPEIPEPAEEEPDSDTDEDAEEDGGTPLRGLDDLPDDLDELEEELEQFDLPDEFNLPDDFNIPDQFQLPDDFDLPVDPESEEFPQWMRDLARPDALEDLLEDLLGPEGPLSEAPPWDELDDLFDEFPFQPDDFHDADNKPEPANPNGIEA